MEPKFTYGQRVRLNGGFFNGCSGFVLDRDMSRPTAADTLMIKYEVLLSAPDFVDFRYWVENAPARKVWFSESLLEAIP